MLFETCSGLACGVYATNNAEACKYIAEDCKVTVAVVEDQKQLDKFLQVWTFSTHVHRSFVGTVCVCATQCITFVVIQYTVHVHYLPNSIGMKPSKR